MARRMLGILRRAFRSRSLRAAAFVFALTRLIVFLIFVLTINLKLSEPAQDFGNAVQEPQLKLEVTQLVQKTRRAILYADSLWYTNIARDGYEREPFETTQQRTWAFFPLYPLLLRQAARFTGEFALTGALLSNLFLFLALVYLHRTVLEFGYDEGCADRTIFYLAAFPVSYFFSLPQTESLFLCLTVLSFYAARRDRWWWAGTFGALASATRFAGILLFPALLVLYWQQQLHNHQNAGDTQRHHAHTRALPLLLIPSGLIAFMLYLRNATGDALAFLHIQSAWGRRPGFFLWPLFDYIMSPLELSAGWNFRLLNFAAGMLALACGLWLIRRREWALSTYTLLSVIAPLSSMTLQSLTRYVMVIFPIYIMLALAARRPFLDQTIRAFFLVLLAIMTALYALHFGTALS